MKMTNARGGTREDNEMSCLKTYWKSVENPDRDIPKTVI